MHTPLLLLMSLSGSAEPLDTGWAALEWGAPLPEGLVREGDWPWATAAGSRCGWRGEVLLCDDGAGLARAYRAWEGPVEGAPAWIRCAGLEWCLGALVEQTSGERTLGRWASRLPPHRGWEWSVPAATPPPAGPTYAGVVEILGGEIWGDAALLALAERLGRCPGALALERFPLEVIYDGAGARKVRFQGFPPDGLEALCVVVALAETPRPESGEAVEIMVTGR